MGVVFLRHRGAVRFGSRNDSDLVVGMTPWTRLCRIVYIVDRQPPCSLARLYRVQYNRGYDCMEHSRIALYGYVYDIRQMWKDSHVHTPWLHTVATRWDCSPTPIPHTLLQPLHCTDCNYRFQLSCLLNCNPFELPFDPGSLITGSISLYCSFFS